MKTIMVQRDDVKVGQQITVWYRRDGMSGFGQGGFLTKWSVEGHITLASPLSDPRFMDDEITHVTIEVFYDADECLEFSEHCVGPVDDWWSGGTRCWPRCTFHGERRLQSYEDSIKDSDVAPSWLDPSYAGERWDDD